MILIHRFQLELSIKNMIVRQHALSVEACLIFQCWVKFTWISAVYNQFQNKWTLNYGLIEIYIDGLAGMMPECQARIQGIHLKMFALFVEAPKSNMTMKTLEKQQITGFMHVLYFMAMRDSICSMHSMATVKKPCICTSVPQVKQQQQQENREETK